MLITIISMLSLTANERTPSGSELSYINELKTVLLYKFLNSSDIISIDFFTPSLIAIDGTTIINLENPYCLLSSKIVRK